MSGRKNVAGPQRVITDGVMTGTSVLTSSTTNIEHLDNVGYQVSWTGTPTGTFSVEVSNDSANWTALSLSGAPAAAGVAGNGVINLNQLPFKEVRLKYTNSAGAGTLTAFVVAKML